MRTADIVVAGAGIIGLACALELRRRGARVIVLERGQPMQESSWAAAGMLAAYDPENPPALLDLAAHSHALYDSFLRRIEALSAVAVGYRTHETLQQRPNAHPLPASIHYRQLRPAEAEQHLPGLSSGGHSFLLLSERSLDPRDLCLAMPIAARAAGIEVRAGAAVHSISQTGDAVRVETDDGRIEARFYLNCMGAWADGLPGTLPAAGTSVTPRKGQMAMVRLPPGAALASVIRSEEVYLVPRGDGRVVVGATVEEAGFDKQIVPDAVDTLLTNAAALWPALREAAIVDRWAGLRPGTADDLPLIGPWRPPGPWRPIGAWEPPGGIPQDERPALPARCFVAAGHFRNGILLAPATADVISSLIAGEPPQVALEAFAPDRGRTRRSCDKHFTAAL